MPEVRETELHRDAEGRVTHVEQHIERPRKRGAGFAMGMLLGLILISGAIVVFAYSQGSFQEAGREADRAAALAEQEIGSTAENVGDRIENATDEMDERTTN